MGRPVEPPPEWPGAAIFRSSDSPELVAELAHTIRSRLTSIMLLTESVHAGADALGTELKGQLALLNDAAATLSVFTANVMTLARGGGDLVGAHPQPVFVSDLLRATAGALRPFPTTPNLSLRVAEDAGGERLGHPMALQRALDALTAAALELTSADEVEVAARGRGGDTVEFTIHAPEAGSGDGSVAAEAAVARRSNGEGWSWSPVGLSVGTARHLLERIGVELDLTTDPQGGVHFEFAADLPPVEEVDGPREESGDPEVAEIDGGAAVRSPGGGGPLPAGPCVLLVEDDRETSTIYSEYLTSHGYRVLVTADAVEGIRLAGQERPSAILMDLSLPGLDGPSAIRRLKDEASTAAIPVLAMTASSLDTDRHRAYASGCDAFVEKPCRPPKLLDAIERLRSGGVVPD